MISLVEFLKFELVETENRTVVTRCWGVAWRKSDVFK